MEPLIPRSRIASEAEQRNQTLDSKLRNKSSIISDRVISEQEAASQYNGVSSFGFSLKSNDQGLPLGQTIHGTSPVKTIEIPDPNARRPS